MIAAQFAEMTNKSGISADALKSRMHADFVWSQIVRGKFRRAFRSARRTSKSRLQASNKEDPANYEFKLRPILFLVPRGAAAAAFEARKRDAEALRARFTSCDEGLRARHDAARRRGARNHHAPIGAISASSSAMSSTIRLSAA